MNSHIRYGVIALIFAIGLAITTTAQGESQSDAFFQKNLRYGARRSTEVVAVQNFLKEEMLYRGPITGNFLSLTRAAVRAFQRKELIRPITGIWDAKTRARANEIMEWLLATETLNNEDGDEVENLPDAGFTVPKQSIPSPVTKRKAFETPANTIPNMRGNASFTSSTSPVLPISQTSLVPTTILTTPNYSAPATSTPASTPASTTSTPPSVTNAPITTTAPPTSQNTTSPTTPTSPTSTNPTVPSTATTTPITATTTPVTATTTPTTVATTTADTVAPIISSIQVANISETGATITWTTNENASTVVEYANVPLANTTSPTIITGFGPATSHSVTLTSLLSGTNYYYRVVSKDSTGNETKSSDYSFTTLATVALTCRSVDFEDDPHIGSNLTGNSPHIQWLNSKGLDITGAPNGYIWMTRMSGGAGQSGVVLGLASPNYAEQDGGISDDETLTIQFVNESVKTVSVMVASTPSSEPIINNQSSTVVMKAFDASGSLLTNATKTFTGVTDGTYTPASFGLSTQEATIKKITIETTKHPYGGVWLKKVEFGASCSNF